MPLTDPQKARVAQLAIGMMRQAGLLLGAADEGNADACALVALFVREFCRDVERTVASERSRTVFIIEDGPEGEM